MVKNDETEETKMEKIKYELELLKERVEDYEARIAHTVEDHPIASVSTAFGVGAAVGVLVGLILGKK
jgi:ElaB/YqjD/DUF883 family membrane-anchored ribosome-binding protein